MTDKQDHDAAKATQGTMQAADNNKDAMPKVRLGFQKDDDKPQFVMDRLGPDCTLAERMRFLLTMR